MAVSPTHIEALTQSSSNNTGVLFYLKLLFIRPISFFYKHLLTITLTVVIILGWQQRDNNYLSAETGSGYLLGIIGGSLMLILLLYPLSKRVALLTRWMPIRYWFGIHMLFGIVGPTMILFHSNFHLGSTNSSIALFSMLLVAISGLFGRYIYTHIHHGLYGTRITLKELKLDTENNHSNLLNLVDKDEAFNEQLIKMEEKVLLPYTGILKSILDVMYLGINAKHLKLKLIYLLNTKHKINTDTPAQTKVQKKIVVDSVNRYTLALRHIAAFKLYERLFSLWHILHLPLFIMMIITAIVHIFAVHMY